MARPRIITARSMNLQFRQNKLTGMGREQGVIGHYSATPRARDWRAGVASAKSFHQYHLSKGWAGIGYHYLISDDGAIMCCRPVLYQGAHVLRMNDALVGVNMPGTTGDRPTRRQARAFWWLLHNAHTGAFARPHRCDVALSNFRVRGHRELPNQSTACPGLFLGMYKRGGEPWPEDQDAPLDMDDGFVEPTPEDDAFEIPEGRAPEEDDQEATGPDEAEAEGDAADDATELPEASEEHDEDLSDVLAEIEGARGA